MLVKLSCLDDFGECKKKFKQIFFVLLVEDNQDTINITVMDAIGLKIKGYHVILRCELIITYVPMK